VVELARKKLLALFQDTYEFDTQDSSTVDSLIEKIDSVVENKKELIEKINTDPRKEYWNQKII